MSAAAAILQGERGELRANGTNRDEPRPGDEVEAQSDEQVGQPQRGEQGRPGITRGNQRRFGQILQDDLRHIADHPTASQHHRCDGKVNNGRLYHHEARVLRQHRRATEDDDEPQAHPLHWLDPAPRQPKMGELHQTGGDGDDSGGKNAAGHHVDDQKQDRRQEVAE